MFETQENSSRRTTRGTRSFVVKRIVTIAIVLALLGASVATAQVTVGTYPSIEIDDSLADQGGITQTDINDWENTVNTKLATQVDGAVSSADEALGQLPDLSNLAGAFANAGIFATNVATLRSYTDYQSFYLAAGTNIGVQLPAVEISADATDPTAALYEALGNNAAIGGAWQTWAASLGLSMDFLIDGLYLSGKFGSIDVSVPIEEGVTADIQSRSVGGFLNYLLVGNLWPNGPIRFRGISVGAGAVLHSSGVGIGIPVGDILEEGSFEANLTKEQLGLTEGGDLEQLDIALENQDPTNYPSGTDLGTVLLNPEARLSVENRALTIPIEVATALRLLWLFDFSLGAGVDLSLGGSSDIAIEGEGSAEVTGYLGESDYLSANGGSITLSQVSSSQPAFLNPRITFGTAFNLGPFKIDVPAAVYFPLEEDRGPGLSLGLNVGLLW